MATNIIVQNKKIENVVDLSIIQSIHEIRGMKVMLDFDLAQQYGIETRVLKQAVKRNIKRFEGDDFMFEITRDEYNSLRSQFVTLEVGGRGKYSKYQPFAFTELGVAMLSSVLHSDTAIDINRKIMRAFVAIRQYLLTYAEIKHELDDFVRESNLKFDTLFKLFDEYIAHKKELEKPRRRIGFRTSANSEEFF